MRVITSKVVDRKVEVPNASLEEGLQVAMLAPDANEPVELSPAEQRELAAAMEEIRRGDFIDGAALLDEIPARTPNEPLAATRRVRAVAAVDELQRCSVRRGTDSLTPEVIDTEIAAARQAGQGRDRLGE